MNARVLGALAAGLFATTAPVAAQAAPFLAVFEGTITAGFDTDGLFGTAGQRLVGQAIRAEVTYVTNVPGSRTMGATSDEVTGGDNFERAPVITSAVITIAGKSAGFTPTYYSDVYTSTAEFDVYAYDTLGNSLQTYILTNTPGSRSLERAFSATGTGDGGGVVTQFSNFALGNDLVDFQSTSISVAVPEPATWAMTILGFGLVGGALRRRGAKPAAAAALA